MAFKKCCVLEIFFVSDHFMGLIQLCMQPFAWNDFHDETNAQAYISTSTAMLKHFFMSVYFLKCYPNETQMAGTFRVCEKTARKCCWYFLSRIQNLKHTKVSHHSYQTHCHLEQATNVLAVVWLGYMANAMDTRPFCFFSSKSSGIFAYS